MGEGRENEKVNAQCAKDWLLAATQAELEKKKNKLGICGEESGGVYLFVFSVRRQSGRGEEFPDRGIDQFIFFGDDGQLALAARVLGATKARDVRSKEGAGSGGSSVAVGRAFRANGRQKTRSQGVTHRLRSGRTVGE